ncbi:MAG: hypothetical protein KDJ38_03665 [Gammaproteobacteria bacterium]|nr:hypothetical protein [Gammaproteobacteria bacterium]
MGGEIADDFEREMGLSHREFFRTLPAAMGHYDFEVQKTTVTARLETGSVTISLAPESVRRIASIAIPKTAVRFVFTGVTAEEKHRFISYFDKRFQRGGG